MLIAKLTPVNSDRFNKVKTLFEKLPFDKWNPILLIGPWIMFTAGWVSFSGKLNRELFWDWSNSVSGLIGLVIVGVFIYLLSNKNYLDLTGGNDDLKNTGVLIVTGLVLFIAGYGFGIIDGLIASIPYLLGLLSVKLVYMVPLTSKDDGKEFSFEFSDGKIDKSKIVASTILAILSMILGIYFDDPIISTSAAVFLPFLIVTLIGNGIRHILRTRFYGLFIPAMFIASRIPWLLIGLFLVFYLVRLYNFYTMRIVYPSFGIDFNIVRRKKGE